MSKLHARLELSVAGQLSLSDAESSNGTKVRDIPLAPNEKQVLRSGTQVAFGSCSFLLVSVEELEGILSRSGRNQA